LKLGSKVLARARFFQTHWNLSAATAFFDTLCAVRQKTRGGCKMAVNEAAAAYRLHSAQCTKIAQRSRDPEIKLALLSMAQAWLALAHEK
jgi:hypothetical protein